MMSLTSEIPKSSSPRRHIMLSNVTKSQVILFTLVGIIVLMMLAAAFMDIGFLSGILIFAIVMAAYSLPVVQRITLILFAFMGKLISLIGHGIGYSGDWFEQKMHSTRERVGTTTTSPGHRVPSWDEIEARKREREQQPAFIDDVLN